MVNLISEPEVLEDDSEGDGRRFYSDGPHVHEYLKELTRDTGIGDMVTAGEMSSTRLEDCIRYSSPAERELSMCFNFPHLKVDYKDGDKWALMEPDRMALKRLFREWQTKMEQGNGWNALFWCNHDQPRIVSRMGHEGRYWKESAKMLAAAVHLMRGLPIFTRGGDRDDQPSFQQPLSVPGCGEPELLPDPSGQRKVRGGGSVYSGCKVQGQQQDTYAVVGGGLGGFTEGTPWIDMADNYRRIHAEGQMEDPDSVYSFYKKLIRMRRDLSVISMGSMEFLEEDNPDVLAYRRRYEGKELVVVAHLTEGETQVAMGQMQRGYEKVLGNYDGVQVRDGRLVLRDYEAAVFLAG